MKLFLFLSEHVGMWLPGAPGSDVDDDWFAVSGGLLIRAHRGGPEVQCGRTRLKFERNRSKFIESGPHSIEILGVSWGKLSTKMRTTRAVHGRNEVR